MDPDISKIAVATDYKGSGGDPEDSVRRIARAGFTHLHWCHQWHTDHLYSDWEIARIAGLLRSTGLKLLDIHGSDACAPGALRCWYSTDEAYRRAGVELVANRLRMHAMLRGEGTLMMHIPVVHHDSTPEQKELAWRRKDALMRSLDELVPLARGLGIPIALENMARDTWEILDAALAETPADVVGLCYDSGHANIDGPDGRRADGIEHFERHLDRLQALHLHDNDGSGDQHLPPFYGSIDWKRVVSDVRRSAYPRIFSFELAMHAPAPVEPDAFCADAIERCRRAIAL